MSNFFYLIGEVGFPIAGAIIAGIFIYIVIKFILASVTQTVTTMQSMIKALDNRVQTMNNDLVKIDSLLSHVAGVRPDVSRIAANEGKEDARRD